MAKDPELLAHQQWLGYLQPVGLVVSPPALVAAGAVVSGSIAAEHARFLEHTHEVPVGRDEPEPAIDDLAALLTDPALFGWQPADLVPANDPRAAAFEVVLPAFGETLRPTHAVPDPDGGWLLLVQELPLATDLDDDAVADAKHWQASPQTKFERLLRETGVPIGLLSNRTHLRLVYFPRGESPGYVTFPVAAMTEVAGRPVLAALLMLLGADRLFTLPDRQRLPALLAESRKYQNTVSTELAEQVLAALFELLRGFQAADDQRKGELLRDVLTHDPDQVYAGLVTVLMRLVFLLYAEDRGLMSDAEVYQRYYSVTGLWDRLREDEGRNPDTMDQRYGGWAHLLALFRLVHDGGRHTPLDRRSGTRASFELPARHGYLFDPDRYPFLEGRTRGSRRAPGERIVPPLVSDGVLFRVLRNLLVLDGERISYRTLDVEQIGSVYEAIMGYRLERAAGRSIALKPKKAHGAPVTINLDALLAAKAADRGKFLAEHADQKVEGKALNELKAADSVEGLVAALERRVARALTPNIVPPGGMVLQPSDERRRSGSHYTPRSLTEPIVRKALEPILKQLGGNPTPDKVLGLKVCDPAMGSGAFLVEACRQVGDALLKAWLAHASLPKVPDDETPELLAQRAVAQRCLYGVDKNPMAVDLAKLSLWLATLAQDHPFTFLDHNLKWGDSLVGLGAKQIRQFHWKPAEKEQMLTGQQSLYERVETATRHRWVILESGDFTPQLLKEQQLKLADEALNPVRFAGNLAIAAFFAADSDKKRNAKRQDYKTALSTYLQKPLPALRPNKEEASLRDGQHPVHPFHWEIEFPEVFGRQEAGFDVIVGNPPFAGSVTLFESRRSGYTEYLREFFQESGGKADQVAFFFRRAFDLLRPGGTFGLIATNTIAQGDTRSTGLRWICTHGGAIYSARRRYKWPGIAAVIVSVIHVCKGMSLGPYELDGLPAERITAFLFHTGGHGDPEPLAANASKSFNGAKIYGQGFLFADGDEEASPVSLMHALIKKDVRNGERIFPYIGGEELNDSPKHAPHRYAINFGEMLEEQARQWPDLMRIVDEKVKPYRREGNTASHKGKLKNQYWIFGRSAKDLYAAAYGLERVLALARVSPWMSWAFLPASLVFSEQLIVVPNPRYSAFGILQSRLHEGWARFLASSMKDDLRYTPTDCFETFPFPEDLGMSPAPEAAGKAYYEFRADLMVRNNEGLTKTYNRFHDPNETSADILKLRELHAAMDRAVLDAYGGDLAALAVPPCEFLLDYEDVEDEDEEPGKRQRKKPWRYRWPDAFRDEVLALLLDLNKQRAEQERLTAPLEKKPKKVGQKRPKQPRANAGEQPTLEFTSDDLSVDEVEPPPGTGGPPITVSFTVLNRGTPDTGVSSWMDRVYLSLDNQLGADDYLLGDTTTAGAPKAENRGDSGLMGDWTDVFHDWADGVAWGGLSIPMIPTFPPSPVRTEKVDIPPGLAGQYYLSVVVDSSNSVYELDEANNVNSTPIPDYVFSLPPELTPGDGGSATLGEHAFRHSANHPGATLSITAGNSTVVIAPNATVTVSGTLSVTGGSLHYEGSNSTGSIQVNSGGHLTASSSAFAWDQLTVETGQGQSAGSALGTTLVMPTRVVPRLGDNQQFQDIDLQGGSPAGMSLNPLGAQSSALRYVFPGTWSVVPPDTLMSNHEDLLESPVARSPGDSTAWGGSISFDASANWCFGGQPTRELDFYSIATHELGHALGFGTESINASCGVFSISPTTINMGGGRVAVFSGDLVELCDLGWVYDGSANIVCATDPLAPVAPRVAPEIDQLWKPAEAPVGEPWGFPAPSNSAARKHTRDQVQCAVFAPGEVARGQSVLIQVFAHRVEQAAEATRMATEFDGNATRRGFSTLAMEIDRGKALRFELRLPFTVDPNEATLIWRGLTESVQFEAKVPKGHPAGDVIGTVLATLDDVPVGLVKFKLVVTTRRKKAKQWSPELAQDHWPSRFRQAFVSYSSKDREMVERMVGLLAVAGIDYFQDVRDLKPGEPWRPQLESAIDMCDLFLLFWSSNALASSEVKKEIARAVSRMRPNKQPPPVIWPYVIEGPPDPPPPPELTDVHFGHFRYTRPRFAP